MMEPQISGELMLQNQPDLRKSTTFLRCIAILLVINSHLDALYPVPWLGTGGAMGNSLFFMLSSFGLLLSEKNRQQTFVEYYVKRIKRIYPAVWTSIMFLILPIALYYHFTSPAFYQAYVHDFGLDNPLVFIGNIFFPPQDYWFLRALMFFYLVGFMFIRNYSSRKILVGLISLVLLYVTFYLHIKKFSIFLAVEQLVEFKLVFYGLVFLLGLYFASISERIKYEGILDVVALLVSIGLIYGHKYLMLRGIGSQFQFVQQVFIIPMLYYALKVGQSPFIQNKIMAAPAISGVISLVGAMTLELYIVHGPIRPIVHQYVHYFPENIFAFGLIVFPVSYLFYKANRALASTVN